jgi:transposase
MRGGDQRTEELFSYVSCEARVPPGHPLRPVRAIVDEAVEFLSLEFEGLYSKIGRPSIPPEKLLWALLLQVFYSIRSECQLMEQLNHNHCSAGSSDCRWIRRWRLQGATSRPFPPGRDCRE